jgi:2'-5' RNA ligase
MHPPPPDRAPEPSACARLFVALWPDAAVCKALAAQQGGWAWPAGARLTPPERLHLTVHFLGAVARERLPALVQGLAIGSEPVELLLGVPEVWSGGIAVLQPLGVPQTLQRLHGRLAEALNDLAQPVARERLRPHVTLARRACTAVPPSVAVPVRWTARGFALVESQPAGRYRIVAEYA